MTTETATDTSTATTTAGDTQTTDTNASDTTLADAANATTEAPKAEEPKVEEPKVPETYDLKMPEGVELDKAAADEFTAVAKELKLDNPTAQKLADVAAKMAQRQTEKHAALVQSWVEQIKTDKEIGGDKFEENLAVAQRALNEFGSPELKDVLNASGLGNHPAVVKAFYNAGKRISQDRIVTGSPKGGETDVAKKLFPNMN